MTTHKTMSRIAKISLGALVAGCFSMQVLAADDVKLAITGPFSGGSAPMGTSMRDGAKLAIQEINAAGGIDVGGKKMKISIIERDDEAKNDRGALIAQELSSMSDLAGVIGTVNTGVAVAGDKYYQEKGITKLITPAAGSLSMTQWSKAGVKDLSIFRFAADDIREFQSRSSTGVRAMKLLGDDQVISLSILRRVGTTAEEREAYLRFAPWKPEKEGEPSLSAERMAELEDKEQFILTVCANGYGKLSSAYEYRRTGRGGQGITNIDNIGRNGPVVASFPATKGDQLMLVTDQAKLIRMPLDSLRVIGRGSAGVRLFNVDDNEHVVGAAKIEESDDGEEPVDAPVEAGTEN